MRKFCLLFASLAAGLMISSAAAQTPRPAPEFAVHLTNGGDKLLSQFRGKPVCLAFFYTTCPHCQDMSRLISRLVPEYSSKGVQFVAAAFDDDAKSRTAAFVSQYVNGFPMGYADRGSVYEFLQQSIMTPLYVPILVFIDRKGIIQSEYIGDSTFLANPEQNMRAELDKLLKPAAGKAPAKPVHLTKK